MDYSILVFIHVALFAYWLGPDFSVYVASHYVWNPNLPIAERRRFLAAIVRMAQVSRNSLILLLPVGLTLAALSGISAIEGLWLLLAWALSACWLTASIYIYRRRGNKLAQDLDALDRRFRQALGVGLIGMALWSVIAAEPFANHWVAAKAGLFGVLLFNSIAQRKLARRWLAAFAQADAGHASEAETVFANTKNRARRNAYLTWSISLAIAFLGVVKPF